MTEHEYRINMIFQRARGMIDVNLKLNSLRKLVGEPLYREPAARVGRPASHDLLDDVYYR